MNRAADPTAFLIALVAHLAMAAAIYSLPPVKKKTNEIVRLEIAEVHKKKPQPLAPLDKKPEPPKPKPAPPKVAKVIPPPDAPPPPPKPLDAPPPPNEPPPKDAKPNAPIRIGVSLSSTTAGGSFAAPVGNTLYGKIKDKAEVNPEEVKPYVAPHYAPATQVTTMPSYVSVSIPWREEYPEEARRLEIEDDVVLQLVVDDTGRVVHAKAITDPGHGLAEAAVRIARKYFRFKPATRNGEPVSTTIPFTLHFELI
jgi:protein TonB